MQWVYSSVLTMYSSTYCPKDPCSGPLFYYQTILINVTTSGYYSIACNSTMDTYGYLYINSFDSYFPNQNLFSENNNSAGNGQFKFVYFLQPMTVYILVVTTSSENVTGAFSIIATNATSLNCSQINITSKN